jgi:hypothetical protein
MIAAAARAIMTSSRATIAPTIQRRAVIAVPSQLRHSYGSLGSMSFEIAM